MHIPDGYLSPATCGALYTGVAPFWWASLRRVQRGLHTQMVPLLSVSAAFCFIIMMFNLPLPGGTTGHAVGVGISAIVLGPWASMLAISIALIIQAIFFGDGGITAIGANCFNMGVIGSLVAYATYRAVSGNQPIESSRRVWAAALAGYLAINASALAAAIELGIQPLLYRDALGTPLYAPYPLNIAVPAMMAGHLTVAGLAEMIVAGGVVTYLQKAEPALLRLTAPGAGKHSGRGAMKPLWIGLAALALLTPLGILAVGSAWSEWSIDDLLHPETRHAIAAVSGGNALPTQIPSGLARWADVWTAPVARYAPGFVRNGSLGYMVAGIMGMVSVIAVCWCLIFLLRRLGIRRQVSFIERTLKTLMGATEYAASADAVAESGGLLQSIDPRVKMAGLLLLIIATAAAHRLFVIGAIFLLAIALAFLSHVRLWKIALWVWLPVLFFTGAIALPALIWTPGSPLYAFGEFAITRQGLRTALFLLSRAETAVTLSGLLVFTTPWPLVLKSLRALRCPASFIAILGMTYRYTFEILRTALDMFESRRSRTVGFLSPSDSRRLAASTAGVLLSKSFQLSGDVHLAMQSRGFRGEIHILPDFHARAKDWCWLALFTALAAAAFWWGA